MPDLSNAIAVGATQVVGDKFARKRSSMVAVKHGAVTAGSTYAVCMLMDNVPTANSAVLALGEEYGQMVASAALSTVANRQLDGKSLVAKGVLRDFLWSLGYQAVGSYIEEPIKPYLPAGVRQ